jgi:hypothetical protein
MILEKTLAVVENTYFVDRGTKAGDGSDDVEVLFARVRLSADEEAAFETGRHAH